MGGSFGGYMTNLIGTRTDRFAALVSHAGIYHYPQFRGTTDEPAWFAFGFGFEPEDDEDAFTRHSPHRHISGWRTPTLVLHGDRDYRVPVGEALALFEALQRHGVESELVIFPDENHWIMRPANVVAWYEAWLAFCAPRVGLSGG
ncbi:MAG: prolyl oligopeptidase family serine peptidase, partial [Myxococcales bacterium]|nr:prolyl oligopeptidase family serine peptidase [Myxococcales bacterium]